MGPLGLSRRTLRTPRTFWESRCVLPRTVWVKDDAWIAPGVRRRPAIFPCWEPSQAERRARLPSLCYAASVVCSLRAGSRSLFRSTYANPGLHPRLCTQATRRGAELALTVTTHSYDQLVRPTCIALPSHFTTHAPSVFPTTTIGRHILHTPCHPPPPPTYHTPRSAPPHIYHHTHTLACVPTVDAPTTPSFLFSASPPHTRRTHPCLPPQPHHSTSLCKGPQWPPRALGGGTPQRRGDAPPAARARVA